MNLTLVIFCNILLIGGNNMISFLFIRACPSYCLGVFIFVLNEIVRVHITASDNMKMALYKCVLLLMLGSFSFGVVCATVAWLLR